jgi:pectate lyase
VSSAAVLVVSAGCASAPAAPPPAAAASASLDRAVLGPNDGWAAAEGGTRGGADAQPEHVFDVRNRAELVAALAAATPGTPRIVRVHGTIDLSVDAQNRPVGAEAFRDPAFDFEAYLRAFDPATWGKRPPEGPLEEARLRSAQRQKETVVVAVPSNTTIVGIGRDARIEHGMLLLKQVRNVIVRNLHFADAFDHFPAWDPKDNANGEWNSEYDNVSLAGATQVWIDHCTFSDGLRPDHTARTALGRPMQHHDGLLDITSGSNHVTVSYNRFHDHDKTNLVGSSDKATDDAGRLKVTFHHNWWERTKERAPRVRYGEVHVYNNLYTGNATPPYAFGYSIGVGVNSRVFSENNVWRLPAGVPATALVKLWKGQAFFDRGSLLNGQPVDLLAHLRAANPGAVLSADVGWQPRWHGTIEPAEEVERSVKASAGAGRL